MNKAGNAIPSTVLVRRAMIMYFSVQDVSNFLGEAQRGEGGTPFERSGFFNIL